MIGRLIQFTDRFIKPSIVHAHCDVPCGVYETDTLTHGVETVKAMTEKLLALGDITDVQAHNTAVRMISTKEEWAEKIKREILILWTDYFKPENVGNAAELHEAVWQAAKLCSEVKREVNMEKVEALSAAVEGISKRFHESKMIGKYVVKGHSMEPTFSEGDRLLIRKVYRKVRKGDVVVFTDGERDYLKRVAKVKSDNYIMKSDNKTHEKEWLVSRNRIKGKLLLTY